MSTNSIIPALFDRKKELVLWSIIEKLNGILIKIHIWRSGMQDSVENGMDAMHPSIVKRMRSIQRDRRSSKEHYPIQRDREWMSWVWIAWWWMLRIHTQLIHLHVIHLSIRLAKPIQTRDTMPFHFSMGLGRNTMPSNPIPNLLTILYPIRN